MSSGTMNVEYDVGDRVVLNGLNGFWEIIGIGAYPDSVRRYVLRVEGNHKYKHADGAELVCCERTFRRLTARN